MKSQASALIDVQQQRKFGLDMRRTGEHNTIYILRRG
jgi:hypothetical protein